MWKKNFLSPTCLHQSSQEGSGGSWEGVDFVSKIHSCSALLLWAVFSIPSKGCTLDEDTEGTAKHKAHCMDLGITLEKSVLLKTWGSLLQEEIVSCKSRWGGVGLSLILQS